jgi:tetratricopeptide (TPR) repeat protein
MIFDPPSRLRPSGGYEARRLGVAARLIAVLAVSLGLLVGALGVHAETRPSAAAPLLPPADLRDLDAWLDFKSRGHVATLPVEARLFHRRGLIAWRGAEKDEAIRLVRGAAQLDPSYAAPHMTLASWYLTREPTQALQSCAALLDLVRDDFLLQLDLVANGIVLLMQALFFGILGAAVLLIFLRHSELLHIWEERLGTRLMVRAARGWALAFLLLPMMVGFGLALPALLFLGMLWPHLRLRERALFVALTVMVVAAPFAPHLVGQLAVPLREDAAPFFGVPALRDEPWSAASQQRLAALSRRHPDSPLLQFGLAWSARRGGDLATAEAAYRKALERWPTNDRVLNNLGNLLAVQGRFDDALEAYQKAAAASPANAAAHFNRSQVYTRLYDYRAANEALARASALDFELVRSYQAQSAGGALPLVDQWIAPAVMWGTLIDLRVRRDAPPAVPPAWRSMIEPSQWQLGVTGLVLAALGLGLGLHWQRRLPVRACSNCQRVVCRRCAQRRREEALCPNCAMVAARAASPEFTKVLLLQHARRLYRSRRVVTTALAALIPGFGLLAFHRVFRAIVLLAAAAWLSSRWLGPAPFVFGQRVDVPGPTTGTLELAGWIATYLISILSYISLQRRADAAAASARPVRSRVAQVTHLPAETEIEAA